MERPEVGVRLVADLQHVQRPAALEPSTAIGHELVEAGVAGVLGFVDVSGPRIDHQRFVGEAAHVDERRRVARLHTHLEVPAVARVARFLTGDPRAPRRHAAGAIADGPGERGVRGEPPSSPGVEHQVGRAAAAIGRVGDLRAVEDVRRAAAGSWFLTSTSRLDRRRSSSSSWSPRSSSRRPWSSSRRSDPRSSRSRRSSSSCPCNSSITAIPSWRLGQATPSDIMSPVQLYDRYRKPLGSWISGRRVVSSTTGAIGPYGLATCACDDPSARRAMNPSSDSVQNAPAPMAPRRRNVRRSVGLKSVIEAPFECAHGRGRQLEPRRYRRHVKTARRSGNVSVSCW